MSTHRELRDMGAQREITEDVRRSLRELERREDARRRMRWITLSGLILALLLMLI